MKRIVFVIAILFSVDAYAATAKPPADNDGFFFKPYIGVDYEYTSASYNNIGASNVSYGDILANLLMNHGLRDLFVPQSLLAR